MRFPLQFVQPPQIIGSSGAINSKSGDWRRHRRAHCLCSVNQGEQNAWNYNCYLQARGALDQSDALAHLHTKAIACHSFRGFPLLLIFIWFTTASHGLSLRADS
jgi:hypothetical protein